uniref:HSF-type DNA-binding domain-containing protein n=1 Tax=Globisporangium ultimum (strain ATCC 200006 / CBS 805.95 / DAOM BR144) TaxID=431595 RepID=K3XA08_GLOUD
MSISNAIQGHSGKAATAKKQKSKKKPKAHADTQMNEEEESGIPASIKIRVLAAPTTTRPAEADDAEPMDDADDHEDDEEVHAEALRIDALTSPTSVASAPTSPADASGLDTPNGSEGSTVITPGGTVSVSSKRRRLEDPPMFLEKTYEMLEKCSPEVAAWSTPLGDSFIVKKPIAFAEHVIPVYFKHKNFSSFVRQLNFYGFRKVRVDAETAANVDPKEWWEFRHDKFVRGRKDLLREIKRRTIADGRSTIERAEMDELRTEVAGLREQVQQLNKHMMSMMQAMMARGSSGSSSSSSALPSYRQDRPSTPSSASAAATPQQTLPSMGGHSHPLLQFHHQGLPPSGGASGGKSSQAAVIPGSISRSTSGGSAPHDKSTPASTYQLRPLQSVIPSVHHLSISASHLSPVVSIRSGPGSAPAGTSYVDRVNWDSYATTRNNLYDHQQQTHHQQQRFPNAYPTSSGSGSLSGDRSSMAMPGLKRARGDDAAYSSSTPPATHRSGSTPDAAVRQLSMTASQTRSELLDCIIARILGFIRIQQNHAPGEVDAVADAVVSDIQQLLARVQEPSSPTLGRAQQGHSEAACMYRVEILKFISRELPRAVQDSVEKRIPPHVKKSLNRSLLALLVQKAQAALEHQMRVETSPTPHAVGGSQR